MAYTHNNRNHQVKRQVPPMNKFQFLPMFYDNKTNIKVPTDVLTEYKKNNDLKETVDKFWKAKYLRRDNVVDFAFWGSIISYYSLNYGFGSIFNKTVAVAGTVFSAVTLLVDHKYRSDIKKAKKDFQKIAEENEIDINWLLTKEGGKYLRHEGLVFLL
jgi:hypothetical protein